MQLDQVIEPCLQRAKQSAVVCSWTACVLCSWASSMEERQLIHLLAKCTPAMISVLCTCCSTDAAQYLCAFLQCFAEQPNAAQALVTRQPGVQVQYHQLCHLLPLDQLSSCITRCHESIMLLSVVRLLVLSFCWRYITDWILKLQMPCAATSLHCTSSATLANSVLRVSLRVRL